jgi:hypothetical protein
VVPAWIQIALINPPALAEGGIQRGFQGVVIGMGPQFKDQCWRCVALIAYPIWLMRMPVAALDRGD